MNGTDGNHQQDICGLDICTLEGAVIYVDRDDMVPAAIHTLKRRLNHVRKRLSLLLRPCVNNNRRASIASRHFGQSG